MSQVSKGFIVTLVLAMILSGAANTLGKDGESEPLSSAFPRQWAWSYHSFLLVYKTQNSYFTQQSMTVFNHPFMQAVTMFFGEAICIFLFIYFKTAKKEDHEKEIREAVQRGLNPNMNYFWLIIPAAADFFTSNLQYIALNYVAPSLY